MIKTITSTTLALLLIPAVLMSATHAKDIASYGQPKGKVLGVEAKIQRAVDDPMAKALGDLHNHTDKTMIKHNMVKTTGDVAPYASRREADELQKDHPISVKLIELLLSMRLTMAWALSR